MTIEYQMNIRINLRLNTEIINSLKELENYSLVVYGKNLSKSQIIRMALMREFRRTNPIIIEAKKIKGRFTKHGRLLHQKSTSNNISKRCDATQ